MTSPPASALLHLSPSAALLLFTFGILLIYIELNRPGSILPGTVGLLLALLALAPLLHQQLSLTAILAIVLAIFLLAIDLRRRTHALLALAATLCLIFGFIHLVSGPESLLIHKAVAIPCGLFLGLGTSILTRIARRARLNKG